MGTATITFVAYLLVDPAQVLTATDQRFTLQVVAAQITAAIALACLWIQIRTLVLLRGIRLPAESMTATLPYGLLLAVLCGVFTLVYLLWFRGKNAWWSVMMVALILQPTGALRERSSDAPPPHSWPPWWTR